MTGTTVAQTPADCSSISDPIEAAVCKKKAQPKPASSPPAPASVGAPAPPPRSAMQAPKQPQALSSARLSVSSDEACELWLNGQYRASVGAGKSYVLTSQPGRMEGRCVSVAWPALAFKINPLDLKAGMVTSVQVKMQADLQNQIANLNCAKRPSALLREADGTLRQCLTQKIWASKDNARDSNWAQARSWCEAMGPGWRLPSAEELTSLYEPAQPEVACGEFACRVSPLLNLSGVWFWSADSASELENKVVFFEGGDTLPFKRSASDWGRALCVKQAQAAE
jgi:hypothetical protein